MKKLVSTSICIIFFSSIIICQNFELNWAQQFPGNFSAYANDLEHNHFSTIAFSDMVTFNNEQFQSLGEDDILISKLNVQGEIEWVEHIGTPNIERVLDIDVYKNGEFTIYGEFIDSIDIGLSTESKTLYQESGMGRFIAMYNSDRSLKHAAVLEIEMPFIPAEVIKYTDQGHLAITGTYTDSLIYKSDNEHMSFVLPGQRAFLIMLSNEGEFMWWNPVQFQQSGLWRDIIYDDNHIYLTIDEFSQSAIYKINIDDGSFVWIVPIIGAAISSIKIHNNRLYACGDYSSFVDFDPGPNEVTLEANSLDAMIIQYDLDGQFIQVNKMITGPNIDRIHDLDFNGNGDIVTTGCIQSTADFDPSNGIFTLQSLGFEELFIAVYDINFNFKYASSYGSPGNSIGFNLDLRGNNIHLNGVVYGNVDVDFQSPVLNFNENDGNVFMADYYNCPNSNCTSQFPIANFNASTTISSVGNDIKFFDQSLYNTVIKEWYFEGGIPEQSQNQQPLINYTSTGTFDVQLIVENNHGADTLLIEDYITINTLNQVDNDNDGYIDSEDCNDNNPLVNPGVDEIPYNGIDDDCDSNTLDDDLDQDGFNLAEDCNDQNPNINPGTIEIPYNGLDDDCDILSLDDDLDQDGFNLVDDCDDQNENVNPNIAELPYNGLDDDCDPNSLDDDLDQDGFLLMDDCDDQNPDINPNAQEIVNNGIDEDCDGEDLLSSVHDLTQNYIKLYPNPTSNLLFIESQNLNIKKFTVVNLEGRTLGTFDKQPLHLEPYDTGVYIINIFTDQQIVKKRVIIAK